MDNTSSPSLGQGSFSQLAPPSRLRYGPSWDPAKIRLESVGCVVIAWTFMRSGSPLLRRSHWSLPTVCRKIPETAPGTRAAVPTYTCEVPDGFAITGLLG